MMPPESAESVISRICRALSLADGFALYFVAVNLPAARKAFSLQVQAQLKLPVIELHVPPEGFGDTTLDGWLLPQVEGAPPQSAVFLHGLEHALPAGQVPRRRVLQQLNWRRSALARIGRPLVIWLPRHALDSIAEHAPDLYDWYSNVYEFASPKEEAAQLGDSFRTEFSTEVHPAARLSKQEKEQWLHTLTGLLDEHQERNAYRAKLLDDAGGLHRALGNLDDALELYRQSLAVSQEIGDKKGEEASLNNISQIYHAKGDYDTSLDCLRQALAISQEIGDKLGEGISLSSISQSYITRGEYDTALGYNRQLLAIIQALGDKRAEWMYLNNIASIYRARGDYDTALEYFRQALALQREIGNKLGEGVFLINIAQGYKEKGDYDTALAYGHQSLAIQQELGDMTGLCLILFNLGRIHKDKGDEEQALQTWAQAYVIAKKIGLAEGLQRLDGLAKELDLPGGIDGWQTLAEKFHLNDASRLGKEL